MGVLIHTPSLIYVLFLFNCQSLIIRPVAKINGMLAILKMQSRPVIHQHISNCHGAYLKTHNEKYIHPVLIITHYKAVKNFNSLLWLVQYYQTSPGRRGVDFTMRVGYDQNKYFKHSQIQRRSFYIYLFNIYIQGGYN